MEGIIIGADVHASRLQEHHGKEKRQAQGNSHGHGLPFPPEAAVTGPGSGPGLRSGNCRKKRQGQQDQDRQSGVLNASDPRQGHEAEHGDQKAAAQGKICHARDPMVFRKASVPVQETPQRAAAPDHGRQVGPGYQHREKYLVDP